MSTENKRILVAEDNAALSGVVCFNLEQAGFEVTAVRNGAAAWEAVQQTQFDLIITDQQMPQMTGIEFCGRMRELDHYDGVPVILLTAKGLELELPKLRDKLGITATFPKPFSPSEVVQAVRDLVEPSRTSECNPAMMN
jgi:CheY-like chemotaxis protein